MPPPLVDQEQLSVVDISKENDEDGETSTTIAGAATNAMQKSLKHQIVI